MTLSYVLMQNLRRNPLRSVLTAIAFALPMAIFVAAISFVVALVQIGQANAKELRLGVHHRNTLTIGLPDRIRKEIEALDPKRERLSAVCGLRWFGGRVPGTQNTITSLAADPDTFPQVYSDVEMTPEEIEAWQRERRACVVGFGTAEQYGWKDGDRLELTSTVPPYLSLEFKIVKIMQTPSKATVFYFRRDYLNEAIKEKLGTDEPTCNIFWIKCHTPAGLHSLQADIDSTFRNSPTPTKSEDENTFGAQFTQAMGDIPGLMNAMAGVVVLIIVLVAGNTMMMSFRERTRELAVFKAIGFPRRRIFRIVLSESIVLALLGASAGIIPTTLILIAFPVRKLNFGPISQLTVSPAAVIGSFVIALLVGVAAGLWPAYRSMRLQTTDALRHVA